MLSKPFLVRGWGTSPSLPMSLVTEAQRVNGRGWLTAVGVPGLRGPTPWSQMVRGPLLTDPSVHKEHRSQGPLADWQS